MLLPIQVKLYMKLRRGFVKLLQDETGDVPGWVLILLMTAGLVTLLWAIAGPKLATMLNRALDGVGAN
jgi:hypothetical protein